MRRLRWIPGLLLWAALGATGLSAQDVPPPPDESVGPDLLQETVDTAAVGGPVTPLGAFLRAVAVPGWGHAAVGAHGRGGFYLTTQAVTGWMMLKTRSRLNAAKELRALREAGLRAELAAAGITDENRIQSALEDDDQWAGADRLAGARQQQFEDWLALGIFTVLLSGADALVSAHLQDFPDVSLIPVTDEGRSEFRITLPVGRVP